MIVQNGLGVEPFGEEFNMRDKSDFSTEQQYFVRILQENPTEENLWQAVVAFQDYPFFTASGLPYQYQLKTGKNGLPTKEPWI